MCSYVYGILWKPFEHKEFSCNILFCVLKCFSLTATFISSDRQWISGYLSIENVLCCDWLSQNLLLHYLTSRSRYLFSLLSTRASALWYCRFARLASSLAWLVDNYCTSTNPMAVAMSADRSKLHHRFWIARMDFVQGKIF